MRPDLERLACALAALQPVEAAWVLEQQPKRLDRRDAALQAARALLPDKRPMVAACALERAIHSYLASSSWERDRWNDHAASGADAMEQHLHRFARMNRGRTISARQIDNICGAGFRG